MARTPKRTALGSRRGYVRKLTPARAALFVPPGVAASGCARRPEAHAASEPRTAASGWLATGSLQAPERRQPEEEAEGRAGDRRLRRQRTTQPSLRVARCNPPAWATARSASPARSFRGSGAPLTPRRRGAHARPRRLGAAGQAARLDAEFARRRDADRRPLPACAVLGEAPAVEALLPGRTHLFFSHDQGPAREHGLARRGRAARSADRLRVHPRRRRDGGRRLVAFGRAGRAGAIGSGARRRAAARGGRRDAAAPRRLGVHARGLRRRARGGACARGARAAGGVPAGAAPLVVAVAGARGTRARRARRLDALGADDAPRRALALSELPRSSRAPTTPRGGGCTCARCRSSSSRAARARPAAGRLTAPSTSSTPSGTSPLSTRRSRRTRRS